MRGFHALSALLIALQALPAQAASSRKPKDPVVPTRVEIPAPILQPTEPGPNPCDRQFTYRGRTLRCDSFTTLDGEQLRPILQPVPAAVSELDLYQEKQQSLRSLAYLGTLGLVFVLLGPPVAERINGTSDTTLSSVLRYTGLGLLGGSVMIGVTRLKTNESHLEKAIANFNAARPETPIQLQFTTGLPF